MGAAGNQCNKAYNGYVLSSNSPQCRKSMNIIIKWGFLQNISVKDGGFQRIPPSEGVGGLRSREYHQQRISWEYRHHLGISQEHHHQGGGMETTLPLIVSWWNFSFTLTLHVLMFYYSTFGPPLSNCGMFCISASVIRTPKLIQNAASYSDFQHYSWCSTIPTF